MTRAVLLAALAGAAVASPAAPAPEISAKLLSCEALGEAPGKWIATSVVTFAPGAASSPHRHSGTVTAYVLKGRVKSQVDSGAVRIYSAGETWSEPLGAVHAVAENPSATEPAELLAIIVGGKGCDSLSRPA